MREKIYFASDFHLGVPTYEKSLEREKKIVAWLEHIRKDAKAIYLVGDIFDFWFEYKRTIPKGFVRLQGKLAELTDSGVEIHWFTGNHDMWIFDYLPKELGIILHREPIQLTIFGKKVFIGHGDGLGPGDDSYKVLKRILSNKFFQWTFARLHPNLGIWIADTWSRTSRAASGEKDATYLGQEKEWLYIYCKELLKTEEIDLFIFGHRHMPLELDLPRNSRYINLGEWLNFCTYMCLDSDNIHNPKLSTWDN